MGSKAEEGKGEPCCFYVLKLYYTVIATVSQSEKDEYKDADLVIISFSYVLTLIAKPRAPRSRGWVYFNLG